MAASSSYHQQVEASVASICCASRDLCKLDPLSHEASEHKSRRYVYSDAVPPTYYVKVSGNNEHGQKVSVRFRVQFHGDGKGKSTLDLKHCLFTNTLLRSAKEALVLEVQSQVAFIRFAEATQLFLAELWEKCIAAKEGFLQVEQTVLKAYLDKLNHISPKLHYAVVKCAEWWEGHYLEFMTFHSQQAFPECPVVPSKIARGARRLGATLQPAPDGEQFADGVLNNTHDGTEDGTYLKRQKLTTYSMSISCIEGTDGRGDGNLASQLQEFMVLRPSITPGLDFYTQRWLEEIRSETGTLKPTRGEFQEAGWIEVPPPPVEKMEFVTWAQRLSYKQWACQSHQSTPIVPVEIIQRAINNSPEDYATVAYKLERSMAAPIAEQGLCSADFRQSLLFCVREAGRELVDMLDCKYVQKKSYKNNNNKDHVVLFVEFLQLLSSNGVLPDDLFQELLKQIQSKSQALGPDGRVLQNQIVQCILKCMQQQFQQLTNKNTACAANLTDLANRAAAQLQI